MKKTIFILLISWTTVCFALDKNNFLEILQKRCSQLNSLKAEFIQKTEVITAGPLKVKEFKGVLYLKRPLKIRWDYYEPSVYQVMSNGENIWFYDEEEKQVMVGKLENFMDKHLIFSLFLDIKNLEEFFEVNYVQQSNFIILTLVPKKPMPSLKEAKVWIEKNNFEIRKVKTKDHYNNTTTVCFTHIITNPDLQDTFFYFQKPAGVELIRLPERD